MENLIKLAKKNKNSIRIYGNKVRVDLDGAVYTDGYYLVRHVKSFTDDQVGTYDYTGLRKDEVKYPNYKPVIPLKSQLKSATPQVCRDFLSLVKANRGFKGVYLNLTHASVYFSCSEVDGRSNIASDIVYTVFSIFTKSKLNVKGIYLNADNNLPALVEIECDGEEYEVVFVPVNISIAKENQNGSK